MDIDKKKKAIMVAVAYYLEQERASKGNTAINLAWSDQARRRIMQDHQNVQSRGRFMKM